MTVEAWIMLAALLLTVGGLVWGAATIASTVDTLSSVVGDLKDTVAELKGVVNGLDKRVTVLEDRHERSEVL